jgi:O-antigen/teichoic acid export membrane protein
MYYYIQSLIKKNIVQVFIGSASSSIVKIITSIILGKIIAEKMGPNGMGLVGQLTSFVSITLLFATGGYQNGIIKFSATQNEAGNLAEFVKPSLKLTCIIALGFGLLLLLFPGLLSNLVFRSVGFEYIFRWMGFSILLYSFNSYFNSFLNGISDFRRLNILNICNSILSFVVSVLLIYWKGIYGALLAVVLSQTLGSAVAMLMLSKYRAYFKGFYKSVVTKELIYKLAPYMKMTMFSLVLLPTSQIIIRNLITETSGSYQTGIWEAVNRISGLYMLVISNVMLIYYLPRMSVTSEKTVLLKEIKSGMLFFGSITLLTSGVVFILRHIIIRLFLSSQFQPVSDLIWLQATGDLFKVLYYLLAYFVIAKSLTLYYILTELLFFTLYISLSFFWVPAHGTVGAIYSYAIMNFCAFLIHAFVIRKLYFSKRNKLSFFLFGDK